MRRAHLTVTGTVGRSPEDARQEVRAALVLAGCCITSTAPGHVVARRGGRWRSATYLDDRLLQIDVLTVGSDARCAIGLVIRPTAPLDPLGSVQVLAAELGDLMHLQTSVWDGLERDERPPRPLPVLAMPAESRAAYAAVIRQPHLVALLRGQLLVQDLPPIAHPATLTVHTTRRTLLLPVERVGQLLRLSALIGAQSSTLSEPERSAVGRLALQLWTAVVGSWASVQLDHGLSVALELVETQRRLREGSTQRLRQICLDCRFERMINPAYASLGRRNTRIKTAIGVAGALVVPSATALTVATRAATMLRLEPEFVCPRCQGLDFDQLPAVICPGCGQLRREAVIGRCATPTCTHDFLRAAHLVPTRPTLMAPDDDDDADGPADVPPARPRDAATLTLHDLVHDGGLEGRFA